MSDPDFFRMKGYAEKRIKEEVGVLQNRIEKLEKDLKAKDALIGELRAKIKDLESQGKK